MKAQMTCTLITPDGQMEDCRITIKPANPTCEEGLMYARYLDQAAEGFFRFYLGRRAPEIIAAAYLRPDHDYSWKNVFFAECNGKIAGMVSGYSAKQRRCFMNEPLEEAAGGFSLRRFFVHILLAPLWHVLETFEDGDFYVQSVAVEQNHRGRGIGSLLMDHIEDVAEKSNASRLVLDVAASNKGAKKLYERCGIKKSSVWPKAPFFPSILVRMTKPLQPGYNGRGRLIAGQHP